jgi:hypothetical protein
VFRRSKTASAAIAAAVVSVAAAVAPLIHSGLGGSAPTGAVEAVSAGSLPSRGPSTQASGLPARSTSRGTPDAAGPAHPVSVLFLGRGQTLHPKGGSARSYACQAATDLHLRCEVWSGAATSLPGTVAADLLVLALAPQDDATWLGSVLDDVPARLAAARRVVLAPFPPSTTDAGRRRLAAIRRAAAARGVDLIDSSQWLPTGTSRYLAAGGQQLTADGHTYVGARLARALRPLVVS